MHSVKSIGPLIGTERDPQINRLVKHLCLGLQRSHIPIPKPEDPVWLDAFDELRASVLRRTGVSGAYAYPKLPERESPILRQSLLSVLRYTLHTPNVYAIWQESLDAMSPGYKQFLSDALPIFRRRFKAHKANYAGL